MENFVAAAAAVVVAAAVAVLAMPSIAAVVAVGAAVAAATEAVGESHLEAGYETIAAKIKRTINSPII